MKTFVIRKQNEVRGKAVTKVSSVGILLSNPDNMLVLQNKYHLQVRNPSPNVFG